MWFIIVTLQDLVNNESRMLSDCITDDTHSYKGAVREAELWTPPHSQLSGQTHHLEAPSYNLMGRFQRKVHSAWRTTHILALFTPGNPTGQLEVKLPRHGSDDNAPPGLWPHKIKGQVPLWVNYSSAPICHDKVETRSFSICTIRKQTRY